MNEALSPETATESFADIDVFDALESGDFFDGTFSQLLFGTQIKPNAEPQMTLRLVTVTTNELPILKIVNEETEEKKDEKPKGSSFRGGG
jgi:hypothetical protein